MKKKSIKSLKAKAEHLWKEACLLKWGAYCHVKKHYPHIKVRHTSTIQIDHCISRSNKYFFLDVWNGLPVCSGCNYAKNYKVKSVDRAINEMVKNRNPKWFEDAIWLDMSGEPNVNFSKRWYLEEKILDLEIELKKLTALNKDK